FQAAFLKLHFPQRSQSSIFQDLISRTTIMDCYGLGIGGQGGIRTHGALAGSPHFECGAIDHSTTCPPAVIREANAYGKRPDFSQMDGFKRGPVTSAARLRSRRSLLEMVHRTISFASRRTAPHPVRRR